MATCQSHGDLTEQVDAFKHVYKKYKRRDKKLDVTGVIDFSSEKQDSDLVLPVSLSEVTDPAVFPGLKPVEQWRAFGLKNCEGFIVIPNPFEPKYQRYWIQRCLLDFPTKPNKTNLDAHMERPSQVWHHCVKDSVPDLGKDSLLMKLRWATLGYQYEWNTKEYFADRVQAFPDDLKHLCRYIAAALGYSAYSSEAGIVNYYRMESTLMAHTDVSELDKAAPLISFSFGQSCIFMIGGSTKEKEPVPLFLHSGDICIMTGPARLNYHAVPRIMSAREDNFIYSFFGDTSILESVDESCTCDLKNCHSDNGVDLNLQNNLSDDTEEDPYSETANQKPPHINIIQSDSKNLSCDKEDIVITPTVKGNNCSVKELGDLMNSVIKTTDWTPFHQYLQKSRVNVNVRQVLKTGMSLAKSPETIVTCEGKRIKLY